MAKLGFVYDSRDIQAICTADSKHPNSAYPDHEFVGLTFGAVNNTIEIKRIYFSPTEFSFQKANPPTGRNSSYDGTWYWDLSNPSTNAAINNPPLVVNSDIRNHLGFPPPYHFDFAFFSVKQLQILTALSSKIILSGAKQNTGAIAFPHGAGTEFTSLQLEVDKTKLYLPTDFNDIDCSSEDLPFIFFGTPCPPKWSTFMLEHLMALYPGLVPAFGGEKSKELVKSLCNWHQFTATIYGGTPPPPPPDIHHARVRTNLRRE